jgi:21S rRNA (uridine2791-2'-O)-methyltransferase
VERTKPLGRIIGIDVIPAQPPKGVSTIQGNFLSIGVQEEVKRFLLDPDRGRPRKSMFDEDSELALDEELSYIELERHADDEHLPEGKKAREEQEQGRMVDVVLSDMSAPWDQTAGFWKRSLSDPYIRMMNTTGIKFSDHAGSMVRCLCAS